MYGGSWTGDGVYCKMGRDGDGGDGNLKGWESARAWVGDGKSSVSTCQAERTRGFECAARCRCARSTPSTKGLSRDFRRIYWVRKLAALFGARLCDPIFDTSQKYYRAAMERRGG
jgi:hypothetical protein